MVATCRDRGVTYADNDPYFIFPDGGVNEGHVESDRIHLARSGLNRLAKTTRLQMKDENVGIHEDATTGQKSGRGFPAHSKQNLSDTRESVRKTSPNSRDVRCYNCGERGHIRDICRHARKLQCYSCQGYGHKAKFCGGKKSPKMGTMIATAVSMPMVYCPKVMTLKTNAHRDSNSIITEHAEEDSGLPEIELEVLLPFYKNNLMNFKFSHLNMNSVRHKFDALAEVMGKSILDLISIQETKLDESFPANQFAVPNFKMYRKDVTDQSGGLLLYVRSDVPQRQRPEFEEIQDKSKPGRVELLLIEMTLNNEKCFYCSLYKQPTVKNACMVTVLQSLMERFLQERANFIICGDLNINVLVKNCLADVLDVYIVWCKNFGTHSELSEKSICTYSYRSCYN